MRFLRLWWVAPARRRGLASAELLRQRAAGDHAVEQLVHLLHRRAEREEAARDQQVILTGERVPIDAVHADGDLRLQVSSRDLNALGREATSRQRSDEVLL